MVSLKVLLGVFVLCDSASDVCSKSLEHTSHVNILT